MAKIIIVTTMLILNALAFTKLKPLIKACSNLTDSGHVLTWKTDFFKKINVFQNILNSRKKKTKKSQKKCRKFSSKKISKNFHRKKYFFEIFRKYFFWWKISTFFWLFFCFFFLEFRIFWKTLIFFKEICCREDIVLAHDQNQWPVKLLLQKTEIKKT